MNWGDVLTGILIGVVIASLVFFVAIWINTLDGEIGLIGFGDFVLVDVEQEETNRWLDECVCCSVDTPNAGCPKGMLPCSLVEVVEVCKEAS